MAKREENAVEKTEVEGTPKRTKSEQMRKYKAHYVVTAGLPGKSASMDCDDEVAVALRGSSPEAVMAAAEKLKGLDPGTLVKRYKARNPGAKRMNAGNIIRGCVKRGEIDANGVIAAIKAVSKVLNKAS